MRAQSLKEILELCRHEGDAIEVIFPGGIDKLAVASLDALADAKFEYRLSGGAQKARSPIPGTRFLTLVREKSKYRSSKPAAPTGPTRQLNSGHNWYDWVEFHEAVQVCRQQGAKVIVGVHQGGSTALRRMALKKVVGRKYKYDWADHPIGVKNPQNWMPGTEFISILIDLGAISA